MGDTVGQAIDQPMDMSGEVALRRPKDESGGQAYWAWQLYEQKKPLWENAS